MHLFSLAPLIRRLMLSSPLNFSPKETTENLWKETETKIKQNSILKTMLSDSIITNVI